jgi:hypothetical protein
MEVTELKIAPKVKIVVTINRVAILSGQQTQNSQESLVFRFLDTNKYR